MEGRPARPVRSHGRDARAAPRRRDSRTVGRRVQPLPRALSAPPRPRGDHRADQGNRSASAHRRSRGHARRAQRGGAGRVREGPRRERHDRGPDAQRPRSRVRVRLDRGAGSQRAAACARRVAPRFDRARDPSSRRGRLGPPPRQLPARLGHGRAQDPGDARDRRARGRRSRGVHRRRRLREPGRGARAERGDPDTRDARRADLAGRGRRHRGGLARAVGARGVLREGAAGDRGRGRAPDRGAARQPGRARIRARRRGRPARSRARSVRDDPRPRRRAGGPPCAPCAARAERGRALRRRAPGGPRDARPRGGRRGSAPADARDRANGCGRDGGARRRVRPARSISRGRRGRRRVRPARSRTDRERAGARPGHRRARGASRWARRAQMARPPAARRAGRAAKCGAAHGRPRRRRARGGIREHLHRRGRPPRDPTARRPPAARYGEGASARTSSHARGATDARPDRGRRRAAARVVDPRRPPGPPGGRTRAALPSRRPAARGAPRGQPGRDGAMTRAAATAARAAATAPGGYFGRALVVDVGTGEAERLALPEPVLRACIGGAGLGTWLMHRLAPAGVEPLAPEAPLAFVFSPLVGTPLTTSAKFAVVAKSPLTGLLNDALASSHFAIAGKLTGHDAIVVRGAAAEPSVLLVDGEGPRIETAGELWGLSAAEAENRLRERLGPAWRIAAIGPAGERGVRYATVSHDGRHAGRGGLGAVMGSKNLKAVAVRAATKCPTAEPERVLAIAKALRERSFGEATRKSRELGTLANLLAFNAISTLPTRNFRTATFEGAGKLAAEELAEARAVARDSCASCSIGCEHIYAAGDGKTTRVEYENVFALGPMCGVDDPDAVLAASALCDDLGIDTISAGGTIAWAMECAERGIIDAPWLRFGDARALLRALGEIGRREGLGELLAEGSKRASEEVGGESAAFAPHVKGLELPGYEP